MKNLINEYLRAQASRGIPAETMRMNESVLADFEAYCGREKATTENKGGDMDGVSPLPWRMEDSDQGSAFLVSAEGEPIIAQRPATYDEEAGWIYNETDIEFILKAVNAYRPSTQADKDCPYSDDGKCYAKGDK